MASGFRSVHPLVEDVLRSVGVTSKQVTQGAGNARASAGTHRSTGTYQGRDFGRCVDLSMDWPWIREHFDGCLAGGLFPFRRVYPQWTGASHVHCVYLGKLPGETKAWPGWVRVQVDDLLHDLNGLTSHLPLDQFEADAEQKAMLREVLGGDEVLAKVQVYTSPNRVEANRVAAYAYLEEGSVRCNLRPLVERLGGRVLWEPGRPLGVAAGDRELCPLPAEWHARHEGSWTRCDLRPVAEWLNARVEWDPSARVVTLG